MIEVENSGEIKMINKIEDNSQRINQWKDQQILHKISDCPERTTSQHSTNLLKPENDIFREFLGRPEAINPKKCSLCKNQQNLHKIVDCPQSMTLYHATNRQNLPHIQNDGFIARPGRLGKAAYVSDDVRMCLKFVTLNQKKFHDPILLKIKVKLNAENIKEIKEPGDIKNITSEQLKQEKIECIKCPYFRLKNGQILYEYALYKVDYAIVAFAPIKMPKKSSDGKKNEAEGNGKVLSKTKQISKSNDKKQQKNEQKKPKAEQLTQKMNNESQDRTQV